MDKAIAKKLKEIQEARQRKNANANIEKSISRDLTDNSVTKSNALSRAYYRFSLNEKRVMEAIISRLHPMRSDNKTSGVELKASDFAKAYGLDLPSAYRALTKAADGLMVKVIRTKSDDGTRIIHNSLMSESTYVKSQGVIYCDLDSKIIPHLIQMSKKFNSYSLADAANFKSSYTWRMYEILISWADEGDSFSGWFPITVDELRLNLGVPESYGYGQFKKGVLDVVTAELINKSNIILSLEPKKTSRKITSYSVTFMESDQLTLI